MNDSDAIAAGQNAKQALNVLNPAMDQVREAILSALIAASPQDAEKILALHSAIQSLEATRKVIADVVANGALADAALNGAFSPS